MQFTVKDVSRVKKILHVEIPAEVVRQEIDNAFGEIKKKAKIKGFRQGKTPRSVLERLFKKDVQADVTQRLIQDSFIKALKESELNVVGDPKFDPSEVSAQAVFKYDATVEIQPKIDPIDFSGLQLKKRIYSVSDAEIDTQLKLLQKNMAQLKTLAEERPVRQDDFTLIDYEASQKGRLFSDIGKADNFALQVGKGAMAKEIDEQLIGMRPGDEKSVTVRFPADHFNKALADQEVDFKIKLKEIREEILPDIDNEFAKDIGDYSDLEGLKAKISDNLKRGYDKRTDQELNEQVFKALIGKTDFDLPESLVEAELAGIVSDMERSFQYRNQTLEDVGLSREKIAKRYRETAEKQVRRYLILNQIIQQESLAVSEEELDAEMAKMAETLSQPLEQIKGYYGENENRLEFLKHGLLEKKAMALILEKGQIEAVSEGKPEESAPDTTSEKKE